MLYREMREINELRWICIVLSDRIQRCSSGVLNKMRRIKINVGTLWESIENNGNEGMQ